MAYACYDDQKMHGARGGKNPKPAPVTRAPKIAMKGGSKRKPGGGKNAAF